MLTKRQKELLDFIKSEIARCGVSPSYEEMRWELGLASKSSVYVLVEALEDRGFIRRRPTQARAIEIIDRSDATRLNRLVQARHAVAGLRPDMARFDEARAEALAMIDAAIGERRG